jgi:hypothetical protein
MLDLTGETPERLAGTSSRLYRRHRRTRRRVKTKKTTFYRLLARFDGTCGMCDTSFRLGEPIYWCPKTPSTAVLRCHEACYQKHMGIWGPSREASPSESALRVQREQVVVGLTADEP